MFRHLAGLVGVGFPFAGRVSPQEDVRFCQWGAHDALADGLEDFCGAELRDEQAELVMLAGLGLLHIGAGARTARDQAITLQHLDRFGYGDARRAEPFAELGL